MKKTVLLLFLLAGMAVYPQKIRFNKQLNKFCENAAKEFETIPAERKELLDKLAKEAAFKKNIIFTCRTNSRRTLFLQTWMQTAFYYYGIFNKTAYSYGDTITEVYPEVITILKKSGFGFYMSETKVKPEVYAFYISDKYDAHAIYPKTTTGAIDLSKSIVVSICVPGEPQSTIKGSAFELPYVSPLFFEKTSLEHLKYEDLNKQISVEMLYLASKIREEINNFEDYR